MPVIGGVAVGSWTGASGVGGGSTSRTFISPAVAVRANTTVTSVKVNVTMGSNTAKIKHFRYVGSAWDLIHEQSFTLAGAGTQTVTMSSPWDVLIGDVIGIWINSASAEIKASNQAGLDTRYTTGDITGTGNTLGSTVTQELEIEVTGTSPTLAITGDSIFGGHTDWHTHLDTDSLTGVNTVPGGNTAFDLGAVLASSISGLTWANCSRGSTTYEHGAQTNGGVDVALAFGPTQLLVGFGVNDVSTGRSWSSVEANLDTILGKATTAGAELFVAEILPWTAGNDTQAGTIRTWNANLATWCTTNGVTLVETHDGMGQTRGSTGQLDDLVSGYAKEDGVHLTSSGVAALAALIEPYLTNVAPTAAFTRTPTSGAAPLDVDVDGTSSADSDGTIVSWSWDWGDGSPTDSGSTAQHTYTAVGTYNIALTVEDDQGATDTETQSIEISEVAFAITGPPPRLPSTAFGPIVHHGPRVITLPRSGDASRAVPARRIFASPEPEPGEQLDDISVELWNEDDDTLIGAVSCVRGSRTWLDDLYDLGTGRLEVLTGTGDEITAANLMSEGRHLRFHLNREWAWTGRIDGPGVDVEKAVDHGDLRRTVTCTDQRAWLKRSKVRTHPQTPPMLRSKQRTFAWHSPEMDVSTWPQAIVQQLAVSWSWRIPNTDPPWFTPWLPPDGWPVSLTPVIASSTVRSLAPRTSLFVRDFTFPSTGLYQFLAAGFFQIEIYIDGVKVEQSKPHPAHCWVEPVSVMFEAPAGQHRIAVKLSKGQMPDTSTAPGTLATINLEHCWAGNLHYLANGEGTPLTTSTLVLSTDQNWRCLDNPATLPAPTWGRIMRALVVEEGQDRGSVPAAMTLGFSDAYDSAGRAWPANTETTLRTSDDLWAVLRRAHGLGYDSDMAPGLRLDLWGDRGKGSTVAASITGANALQRLERVRRGAAPNTLLVTWADGQFTAEDAARVATDGVIEDDLDLADCRDETAARAIATQELAQLAAGTESVQVATAVSVLSADVDPYHGYRNGDTPTVDGDPARCVRIRASEETTGRAAVLPEFHSRSEIDTDRLSTMLTRGAPGTLTGESQSATPTRWLSHSVTTGLIRRYHIDSFSQGELFDINDDVTKATSTPETFDRPVRLTWIRATCMGTLSAPLTVWMLKNGVQIDVPIVIPAGVHQTIWLAMAHTFVNGDTLQFQLRDKGADGGLLEIYVVAVDATASRVDPVGRLPWQ